MYNPLDFKNQIKGGIIGSVVGDALGVPVEFQSREQLKAAPVCDMIGYGTHNQPAGTWSDDSSMLLITAECLLDGFNLESIMDGFVNWYDKAYMTPYNNIFDMGYTTRVAITNYIRIKDTSSCGLNDEFSNGNGSLMRVLPLSIYLCKANTAEIIDKSFEISKLTHGHIRSQLCCALYSLVVKALLNDNSISQALDFASEKIANRIPEEEQQHFSRLLSGNIFALHEDEIQSSGYVIHSLEAAVWAIGNSNSYVEAVLKAVNLGKDTDTTATITGGLAGVIYGIGEIPQKWISSLAKSKKVLDISDRFAEIVEETKESGIFPKTDFKDQIKGVILGTAVGDSLGLPTEGLKPEKIRRLGWNLWKHRFFFGKGMVSDDTEHTLFVAQALLKCRDNDNVFQRCFAWKLRWWLLGIPAGIGFGTLRAILKLWLGANPKRSGVFSAGNGPAMRSAIIGARFHESPDLIRKMVKASTEITHSDPKAFIGALGIAQATAFGVKYGQSGKDKIPDFLNQIKETGKIDKEWLNLIEKLEASYIQNASVSVFAEKLGLDKKGVSGYIYHTVPVALYSWMHHYGDFNKTLVAVLNCGGDTDTVGAIAGAIAGSVAGAKAIPKDWLNNIMEWPRSVKTMKQIGEELANQYAGESVGPVKYFYPGILLRNLFFTIVVLLHAFMRMLLIFR